MHSPETPGLGMLLPTEGKLPANMALQEGPASCLAIPDSHGVPPCSVLFSLGALELQQGTNHLEDLASLL